MTIKAYLKPACGWSNGVRSILRKYDLAYEDIDIINNRDSYADMVAKSGQRLSPCVEIDGVMLADVSGDEVEAYMLANNLVQSTDAIADGPTGAGCDHSHRPDPSHDYGNESADADSYAGDLSAVADSIAAKTTRRT